MMTVNEVSRLTGVSIRALHYYDQIGLLPATGHTDSGYRLYDDTALEHLQQILLFRELEFSLKDIQRILSNSAFDREKALEQQIELLKLKRQHIEDLIALAEKTQTTGGTIMDFTAFTAFDTQKIKDYAAQAKQQWGATPEYKEFEQKTALKTEKEVSAMGGQLMEIIAAFGKIQSMDPPAPAVQAQVKKLQNFIRQHYHTCSKKTILGQLGQPDFYRRRCVYPKHQRRRWPRYRRVCQQGDRGVLPDGKIRLSKSRNSNMHKNTFIFLCEFAD